MKIGTRALIGEIERHGLELTHDTISTSG
jgi:hypothetical protein